MGLVPVELRTPELAGAEPNQCLALHLAPPSCAIQLLEPTELTDPPANRNGLNVADLAHDLEEHAVSLSAFMPRPPIVRLDRVSKDYREGEESRHVLRETSVELGEGEIVAIRGRSGSGKSTLLNLLAGIDVPTAGEVWVAGTCLSRLSPSGRTLFRRDHLGFVFQFFNLIPTLTVLENVQLPAELGGRTPEDAAARARALLSEVGLEDREGTFPDRLSGGEQQRVAVARALVQDPRLLLADEPTGNLDDATGRAVMALLDRVTRQAGRSLVLVTHSPQVAAMADRVLTIEDGHVVPLEARPAWNAGRPGQ